MKGTACNSLIYVNLKDYILLTSKIYCTKGQIKPKTDWRAVDSPKKQTNEFVLFVFLLFMANKTNSFVRFLGESTA